MTERWREMLRHVTSRSHFLVDAHIQDNQCLLLMLFDKETTTRDQEMLLCQREMQLLDTANQ